MKSNKREQQQGNHDKEQEENTYIRRRTTTTKTVHATKAIENHEKREKSYTTRHKIRRRGDKIKRRRIRRAKRERNK